MLKLLAETEGAFTRESEAILAGAGPDERLAAEKGKRIDRLMAAMPAVPHASAKASPELRQQLRAGFERVLEAAARNEAVLRGALRGTRLRASAAGAAGASYPGRQDRSGSRSADVTTRASGQFDRLA